MFFADWRAAGRAVLALWANGGLGRSPSRFADAADRVPLFVWRDTTVLDDRPRLHDCQCGGQRILYIENGEF
jgi:hypothetical protein